jgi:hypothetical protein
MTRIYRSQVVRFHDQGRVRFYVRHVFASIAMALHMLGCGTTEGSQGPNR